MQKGIPETGESQSTEQSKIDLNSTTKASFVGSLSIRQRAAIFFVALSILLISSMAFLLWQGQQTAQNILRDRQNSLTHTLHELSVLKAKQLETFAYDYSYWGDLIDHLYPLDTVWASENLNPSLQTYQFEGLLVLDSAKRVVYETRAELPIHLHSPEVPDLDKNQWAEKGYTLHFFEAADKDVHEYAIAPLQYERDDSTNGDFHGYLIAMREWDSTEMEFFEQTCEGRCEIELHADSLEVPTLGMVTAILPLPGINGVPVAWLRNDFRSAVLSEVEHSQSTTLILLFVLSLVLIIGGWLIMQKWFLSSLRTLQIALESKNPSLLINLNQQPHEIASSLSLLQDLLTNQVSLEREIESRQLAEAESIYQSRQLKEAMAERDFVLEQAKVALYRHDRDGHFLYFSPGIKLLTGYDPQELLRHYSYLLTDDPMNLIAMRSTERALETGLPQEPYVFQIRRKDGTFGFLEATEIPFYEDQKVAGIVGVCRDISDVYEMRLEQDRLSASVEKSKRMESIVVLAGGVAHDLNNTLGPLVSYPALIREQIDPASKVTRFVNTMEQAARQAAEVVKDLLILARRGRLNLEPTMLSQVALEAVQSTAVVDRMKDHPEVTVQVEQIEDEPHILASHSHLVRCVQNLVINAIEAIESVGSVKVRLSSIMQQQFNPISKVQESKSFLELSVIDTGVGVSEDQISKIFEPYYSTKEMGRSGSGLGLALVYSIVRDHGGYHEITSEVGKGTTISLILPVPEQQKIQATRTVDAGNRKKATILVVDDQDIQREMLQNILESRGNKVVTTGSTREALEAYRRQTFDLVLLDMILEEKTDGADLYASLLEIRSPLPCVVLSGFGPGDRMDYAMSLGAYGVLAKPYTIPQLEDIVHAALEASDTRIGLSQTLALTGEIAATIR